MDALRWVPRLPENCVRLAIAVRAVMIERLRVYTPQKYAQFAPPPYGIERAAP
ncbi:hypothetical protein [Streptomyces sp. NPDC048248]|uniref:hypothetical protein n=1 Tax=Streptomyces sp. NPDC048248 TaxID=3365523 RepID=UPI003715922E